MRAHRLVVSAVALLSFLAAAMVSTASAANVKVEARDNEFVPRTVQVMAGDTVTWTNTGQTVHTVTASDGSWDSGDLNPGSSWSRTFSQVGTITYYCKYHGTPKGGGMAGEIQVSGDQPPPPTSPSARAIDDSCPPGKVPEDDFTDVPSSNPHELAIDCVVWWKIASGTTTATYGPSSDVTRAQMATFIAKTISKGRALPSSPRDHFTDDNKNPHEMSINQLAEVGVVQGTASSTYSPGRPVSRAQMASFLVNAYQYAAQTTLPASHDYFTDDNESPHHTNINKAAEAGFVAGTSSNPPTYEPTRNVKRDQMASFIARVLDALVDAGLATPPA